MTRWHTPITDRTSADVEYLRTLLAIGYPNMNEAQKREYMSDLKGALNRSDLVRIKDNITTIQELLLLELNNPPVPEIPTESYYRKLQQDITTIRNTRYHRDDTPLVPTGALNTYDKWNDIEKIILDAYELILINRISYSYSGQELYSGEVIPLL